MTQPPPPSSQPPGYYPDQSGTMRYWDGQQWTAHTQPAPAQPEYAAQPAYAQQPAQPVKKSNTVRNVILGLLAVFVLLVGGCFALVAVGINEADETLDELEEDLNDKGTPLVIEEGKAFSVRGFDYAAGWKIEADELGQVDITGLKLTNNRKDSDLAFVEIKFKKGTEVVARADCTTEMLAPGESTDVSCISTDELPTDYDEITIQDSF